MFVPQGNFCKSGKGNKDGEFNHPRSRQLEKQDRLWCVIPPTTALRCLSCVESLLQSLEVRVVREESLCFQVQQKIPPYRRDRYSFE